MSMLKIFDNIFRNRIDINFIKKSKIDEIIFDSKYQIVEICQTKKFNNNHILFAVHMTPINFHRNFVKCLNPKKRIVLIGDWRRNAHYYRVLKLNEFKKVYLVK